MWKLWTGTSYALPFSVLNLFPQNQTRDSFDKRATWPQVLPAMDYDGLQQTSLLLVETVDLRDKTTHVLHVIWKATATKVSMHDVRVCPSNKFSLLLKKCLMEWTDYKGVETDAFRLGIKLSSSLYNVHSDSTRQNRYFYLNFYFLSGKRCMDLKIIIRIYRFSKNVDVEWYPRISIRNSK